MPAPERPWSDPSDSNTGHDRRICLNAGTTSMLAAHEPINSKRRGPRPDAGSRWGHGIFKAAAAGLLRRGHAARRAVRLCVADTEPDSARCARTGRVVGACLAIGYGLGVLLRWLWQYLEVPVPRFARHPRRWRAMLLLCAVIVALGLWWGQDWDGVLRKLMGIPPSSAVRVLVVGLGTLVAGTLFIVLGRGVWLLLRAGGRMAQRVLPRRVAKVLGVIATGVLLVMLLNGVIVRSILSASRSLLRRARFTDRAGNSAAHGGRSQRQPGIAGALERARSHGPALRLDRPDG